MIVHPAQQKLLWWHAHAVTEQRGDFSQQADLLENHCQKNCPASGFVTGRILTRATNASQIAVLSLINMV
jgi:hypothetical protein